MTGTLEATEAGEDGGGGGSGTCFGPVDEIAQVAGPVGGLWVAHNDRGICGSAFANLITFARFREELHDRTGRPAARGDDLPDDLYDAIELAFATGRRDELAFDFTDATPFQQSVWEACLGVPPGETRTYAEIAKVVHRPNAVRAVGTALGSNPIPVLVPCHRVLRTDGSLGGYAFGELVKQKLLDREAERAAAA
ncbi:MAG: methylated-DNA--[protein]-cysteine S-methyltransferase [Acidimicrobiales bacterium]|jgi:AraC family transcriptional regulator of adaptative response/methylated-DNA-[protein]-cysteine methyltransferase|uniref:methylated-DNA--[protein]-cysteine S-methyltransferase n=1 Tax=marine metagenome TaxID=408172 RepID=A0A382NHP8_9ZZZZ|nr:methylated-DNA--[protein]-cysteine S-methyltransferase [Actinomycetes bacterium]MDP6104762.1 methylated-DNA--[protein]-cysteine S-methyltransferase [Acidimicrobiales bacterium]MCP4844531.1 methylated-DNA--[protein]-cysteine S-methyltransferase [Actinomycetes bacterium]MDP6241399.1 methylated-DNA--[protein]-cysteine S-methyltransferase [Acidimicrobiales bacterium]MDP7125787.1 methylated-DNA--[protein]-cysteine S-methyltransferase [Acidimicrobiales bacterium]|tara:strand:+ start:435 stop:1019 length:585 start_codon:yes stop_codon:yes gene_type:complete